MDRIVSTTPSGKILVREGVSTGGLFCVMCRADWCDHIMEVITTETDADTIWDLYKEEGRDNVQVPLAPSLQIHVTVKLNPVETMPGMMQTALSLAEPRIAGGRLKSADQDDFIGFLMPGEGRRIMRRMISDWFFPQINFDTTSCPYPYHTTKSQMALEVMLPKNRLATFTNSWTRTFEGMCIACWVARLERVKEEEEGRKVEAEKLRKYRTDDSDLLPF